MLGLNHDLLSIGMVRPPYLAAFDAETSRIACGGAEFVDNKSSSNLQLYYKCVGSSVQLCILLTKADYYQLLVAHLHCVLLFTFGKSVSGVSHLFSRWNFYFFNSHRHFLVIDGVCSAISPFPSWNRGSY